MITRDSAVPLYIQIKEYIRQNIVSGVYSENTRIPSERQLSDQFEVSRLTVTKAITELVQEGLLHTRVGKGTFVTPGKINQELRTLTSFTEEMLRRGQSAASRVLYASVDPAEEEIARALSLVPGAKVMVLKRLRLSDEQAIALEITHIIDALCPNILVNHDFSCESLYRVLRDEYGLHMTHAQQTIEARRATATELELLKIDSHTPILSMTRITFNEQDAPFEYTRSAYRGDRYKFNAVLHSVG